MKKSKYSESQVFGILREQELGKSVIEICRNHGITQGTFYRWKNKYSGMESSDIQKMRDLESENSRLKKLYAERCLEIEALKDVLSKKW